MTVIIHLVRHGEAVWNAEGKYQGQADSGLTALGRQQAQSAAAWLQELPRLDGVACSDLPRVRDTAAPFLAATGQQARIDARLREIDVGTWAGRTFGDVARDEPDVVAAVARGEDLRRGGGETFAETRHRVTSALDDLAAAHESGAVLVVFSHGGPIRLAAAAALGLPSPGHHRIASPGNCSVTTLTWGPPALLGYNCPTERGAGPAPARREESA
ncbi:histidine phosphatase family protein [Ruania zhangjianzhongii]|uniref:histidine phosphatase family protein n=1 Tax=Ruania zhangjianzhongii TaxID=2603206 RepID=UPI0011CCC8F2|nr:histidine phosphatase family protein [Ruania zhangjianzhongii]